MDLIKAHYESVNFESPNAKQYNQDISARRTTIEEFPLTEENSHDPLKLYRDLLQKLTDGELQFHARIFK